MLAMVGAVLWGSGAITPHIRGGIDDFSLSADVDDNGVLSSRVYIEVENEGLASFTLTGISAKIPGLRFLPAGQVDEERAAVTVNSGASETLMMRVVITDCAAVPHEPQPIRFTYRTWMGSGETDVTWDRWRVTSSDGNSVPIAWQRGLAGKVCNEAVSSDWS